MPAWVKIMMQVVVLTMISISTNGLAAWLKLPVPGSILGIAVLFLLLKLGIVKLKWIDAGASWLIAEMLLFFVPAAVGILAYGRLMANEGLRIMLVIACSTVLVMVAAGRIAQRLAGRGKERAKA